MIGFPWAKALLGAILMAAGAWLAVQFYAIPRIDSLQKQISDIRAADEKATADFLEQSRKKQQEIQDAADKAAQQYQVQQADTAKRIAALSADGQRLRNTIATYAAGPYALRLPPPGQTGSGTDDRAVALGGLLGECVDLSAARAADAERLADQVRGLQALVQ